mgnify:CR=1 FL=1
MSNTPARSPIEQAREARPDDAAFQAGLTTRTQVMGPEYVDRALGAATDYTMPMQEFITRNAWGNVWQRPGLDLKTRSLITVAMLTAQGKQPTPAVTLGNPHYLGKHKQRPQDSFLITPYPSNPTFGTSICKYPSIIKRMLHEKTLLHSSQPRLDRLHHKSTGGHWDLQPGCQRTAGNPFGLKRSIDPTADTLTARCHKYPGQRPAHLPDGSHRWVLFLQQQPVAETSQPYRYTSWYPWPKWENRP